MLFSVSNKSVVLQGYVLVLLYPQSQVYKMYPNEPSPLLLSELVFLLPKTQVCIVNTDIVLVISNTSRGAVFSNYKQQNLNCKKEQYTLEDEFTTVSDGVSTLQWNLIYLAT